MKIRWGRIVSVRAQLFSFHDREIRKVLGSNTSPTMESAEDGAAASTDPPPRTVEQQDRSSAHQGRHMDDSTRSKKTGKARVPPPIEKAGTAAPVVAGSKDYSRKQNTQEDRSKTQEATAMDDPARRISRVPTSKPTQV
jgi:hypothetical protein